MNKGLSLYLDSMRGAAALIVFFSHFAYPRFSGGDFQWVRDYNFGSDAVIIFFVMSGFLIAHAAERTPNAAVFTKARISRLYSVALPAVVLTLALDVLGRIGDPQIYVSPWDHSGPIDIEVIRALTFTNEIWFDTSRLGTNGPYWSLAYEAWYYAFFAIVLFTRGLRRILLIAAGALFVGPRILLLAPCWLAGVALYHFGFRRKTIKLSKQTAAAMIVIPVAAYAILQTIGAPDALYILTRVATGLDEPAYALGFSNEFIWNYVLTFLVVINLAGAIAFAPSAPQIGAAATRIIRWPAERSFGLYLYHYPILSCLAAWSPLAKTSPAHQIGLAILALAFSYMLAEVTERRLPDCRRGIDAIWSAIAQLFQNKAARPLRNN